jgi:hypothetical protein
MAQPSAVSSRHDEVSYSTRVYSATRSVPVVNVLPESISGLDKIIPVIHLRHMKFIFLVVSATTFHGTAEHWKPRSSTKCRTDFLSSIPHHELRISRSL